MCGRLRVGKSFFHVLQHWSVQPCVRPFNAVHMTAGHNALRGSGPGQSLAFDNNALALVLLHHKFLRDGFLAIDVLQHGHRDKVFAIATINRRRMVATELGT